MRGDYVSKNIRLPTPSDIIPLMLVHKNVTAHTEPANISETHSIAVVCSSVAKAGGQAK